MGSMLQALNPKLRKQFCKIGSWQKLSATSLTHYLLIGNLIISVSAKSVILCGDVPLTFDLDFFEDYERCPLIFGQAKRLQN